MPDIASLDLVEKTQALNVQDASQVDNSNYQSSEQKLKSNNHEASEDHDNATDDEFFDSHEYSPEDLEVKACCAQKLNFDKSNAD